MPRRLWVAVGLTSGVLVGFLWPLLRPREFVSDQHNEPSGRATECDVEDGAVTPMKSVVGGTVPVEKLSPRDAIRAIPRMARHDRPEGGSPSTARTRVVAG